MNKFREWYITNMQTITWFVIAFLIAGTAASWYKGDYATAVACFLMAGVNFLQGKPFK